MYVWWYRWEVNKRRKIALGMLSSSPKYISSRGEHESSVRKANKWAFSPCWFCFTCFLNLWRDCFALFCFKHQSYNFQYVHFLGYTQPSEISEIQAILNQSFSVHSHKSSYNKIIALPACRWLIEKMSSDAKKIMTMNRALKCSASENRAWCGKRKG